MGKSFSRRRVFMETLILFGFVALGVLIEHTMPHPWFRVVIELIVLGAAPAPTLFALYFRRNPWRERSISRALMTVMVTTAVLLWWTALVFLAPEFDGEDTGWFVVLSLVFYALWRIFFTLRSNQRAETAHLRVHYDRRSTDRGHGQ